MLEPIQKSSFLAAIDRQYKALASVARFVRADKLDPLNDPFDARLLENLAGASHGVQAAATALLPQRPAGKKQSV